MPDWTTCRKAQHPEQTVEQHFSVFTYCGAAHQYDRLPVVVVGVNNDVKYTIMGLCEIKSCFLFYVFSVGVFMFLFMVQKYKIGCYTTCYIPNTSHQ